MLISKSGLRETINSAYCSDDGNIATKNDLYVKNEVSGQK